MTTLQNKVHIREDRSKYVQVRDLLYERIMASAVVPGQKLWTEADLISSLGVSITTVRKAIDELAHLGIVERKVGRGTFLKARPSTQGPASTSVFMLGFLTWKQLLGDGYYGGILDGLEGGLEDSGLHVNVATRQWGNDTLRDVDDLKELNPGAMIFPYSDVTRKPFILKMQSLGRPLLVCNHPLPEHEGAALYFDSEQIGRLAAEHLIERGHRRLAMIAGPAESPSNQARRDSFIQTARQAGLAMDEDQVFYANYSEESGYQAAGALLQRGELPTGVFCCGDPNGFGAIKRLGEAGLRIPDDMAVVSSGGFDVSGYYYPKITTIVQDCRMMGRLMSQWARHALGRESDGWEASQPVRALPVYLRQGETT